MHSSPLKNYIKNIHTTENVFLSINSRLITKHLKKIGHHESNSFEIIDTAD